MKIKDLKPNSVINVQVRVCTQENQKLITKNRLIPLHICSFKVGDETGLVKLTLFNDAIDKLSTSIGEVIKIKDDWAKLWQGNMQLSMGKSGTWEVIKDSDFPSLSAILEDYDSKSVNPRISIGVTDSESSNLDSTDSPLLKVSHVMPNMNVSVKVRICEKNKIKYLTYKSGKSLRVCPFLVGDETGMITFTAFNKEIYEMENLMGKVIELKNCWAKIWRRALQISTGSSGSCSVVTNTRFPTKKGLLDKYRMTQLEYIEKLNPGMVYYSEIVGIKYQANGKTIYKKDAMTELDLKPEPENIHDERAVSVWLKGRKIGYIPRRQNRAVFSALMNDVLKINCMLGVYVPHLKTGYNLPRKVRNVPITISTHIEEIEWRPVILFPEDFMAL